MLIKCVELKQERRRRMLRYFAVSAIAVSLFVSTVLSAAGASQTGKALFLRYCKSCHGDGSGGIGPDLTDSEWRYGSSDKALYQSISKGRSGGMPQFKTTLKKKQIRAVMQYIRSIQVKE